MSENQTALKPFLSKVADHQALTAEEAGEAFEIIMSGGATPSQVAAFLTALRMRGETVDEIGAAVRVIRGKVLPVKAPAGAMDIVGTGGDGASTLNISTATALVVAACGVPVAKHGNRALSSKSGAADVLTALGVNLEAEVPLIERCIEEAGIGFMLAPRHHASFKHVGPVRAEMGIRTIFNILGPLCNPAGVQRILLGVYSRQWVRPIAEALAQTGCEKAWVVHGANGLDELSTTGSNFVCEVDGHQVRDMEVSPGEAGLEVAKLVDIRGGDSDYNAERLLALLDGQRDAYRDIVVFDAAAALLIAGHAAGLAQGAAVAAEAIDSGKARQVLERLKAVSNGASAT